VNGWSCTSFVFADGTIASPIFSYDLIALHIYDGAASRSASKAQVGRIGIDVVKPGVYEIDVYYSPLLGSWRNAFVKLDSPPFLPTDAGSLRVGQGKIPLDFEKNTTSTQTSFVEYAPVSQAIYESYRIGVQWSMVRPHWLADVGYYGNDLQGINPGHTWAAHGAWVPWNSSGDVLHLGLARSNEYPEARGGGNPMNATAEASFKAMPSLLLADEDLTGSGRLTDVQRIRRSGGEGLWIDGPFSLQGELLDGRVAFHSAEHSYGMHGGYLFASWVFTGESRRYDDGRPENVLPTRAAGALETVLRVDSLDMNSASVRGGQERGVTLGFNWYLSGHAKLQTSCTHFTSIRRGALVDPATCEAAVSLFL
jgi:phosphate-selective porin OprO/OprP